jgi:hypothetical protein
MIKRFSFTKRERYSDIGAVTITIETQDNQTDTRALADELDRLGAALPITGVNVQVLDFHEGESYKTPINK